MSYSITIIGTGYIGLTTGVCLAEMGHDVTCMDIDAKKIEKLKRGEATIFEPDLAELMKKNASRLTFTDSYEIALKSAEMIFIAVNTPSLPNGEVNLKYVFQASEAIGKNMTRDSIVINKSTVPVGTGGKVEKLIKKHTKFSVEVVSCPEFLREGCAIHDFFHPHRIILGTEHSESKSVGLLRTLFSPLIKEEKQFVVTDLRSAEMIKYASNSFLAMQISYINELSALCEKIDVDVGEVARGMKLDERIGKSAFLNAGLGFGGSCFPKDVRALLSLGKKRMSRLTLLENARKINDMQIDRAFSKLKRLLNSYKIPLKTAKILILGATFKPDTDDVRESQSLALVRRLVREGAKNITITDPCAASEEVQKQVAHTGVKFVPYNAHSNGKSEGNLELFKGIDLIVLATEWKEFMQLDFKLIAPLTNHPLLLDLRNVYNTTALRNAGFSTSNFGRRN